MSDLNPTTDQPGTARSTHVGSPDLDANNPWPGLAPYEEASASFFQGRDAEAAELLRLVRLAPLTVLYGKSGLGKTSLLLAGLFPLLRTAHYLPVHVRIDFSDVAKRSPLDQVMSRLMEELARAGAEYPPVNQGESLWEYLHRRDLEIWSADNFPLTPVLVLDQFEELFSRSGDPAVITNVSHGLADLIENRIPADLATDAAAHARAQLDLLSQPYRMMLSFREDFLADVREWETQVPSLLRHAFRLEPMTRARAIEAVQRAGTAVLAEDVAPAIVDFVGAIDRPDDAAASEMVIEPVLLSLCCTQLNRRRTPPAPIDRTLVRTQGQDIFKAFYREALTDPAVVGPPDVASFIEAFLIQGDRFRGDYPEEDALARGLLKPSQLAPLTDKHRLLRVVPHADAARIELIHDRLVPVVCEARDERRRQAQQDEQERQAREAQEERDLERARSEELRRERDSARRRRDLAVAAALVSLGLLLWGWSQQRERERAEAARVATEQKMEAERTANDRRREATVLANNISHIVEGRLGTASGLSEQIMYQGIAAYRLAGDGMSRSRAESLIGLHSGLEASGHLRKLIRLPGFRPRAGLLYSPDGRVLAIGGESGEVRLLETDMYRETSTLDCGGGVEAGSAWTLAFSRDGKRLAVGYSRSDAPGTGLVCVFDIAQRTVLRRWTAKGVDVHSLAYGLGTQGEIVITGNSDRLLRVFDVTSGETREHLHPSAVAAVAVSADGAWVASGIEDGSIRVWKVADLFRKTTVPPVVLKEHTATVQALAFSPGPVPFLVSVADDGRVVGWNTSKRCVVEKTAELTARLMGVAVTAEPMVAVASADSRVRLFRFSDGAPCWTSKSKEQSVITNGVLTGHDGWVWAVTFNGDAERPRLASTADDGSIRIWGPTTGASSIAQLKLAGSGEGVPSTATAKSIAISPDGQSIVAGDSAGSLHEWHTPTWTPDALDHQPASTWKADSAAITNLAYVTVNGRTLIVSGGDEGVARRWEASSHRRLEPDMAHGGSAIQSIAVSPDATTLATGSRNGTVRLWNAATGTPLTTVEKPPAAPSYDVLYAVGFTNDGARVAVGTSHSGLRLVDRAKPTAENPRYLPGHFGSITAFAHGKTAWLISVGADGQMLEWPAASSQRETGGTSDVSPFERSMRFRDHKPLGRLATSADGSLIITGGEAGQVQLWDGRERLLIGSSFLASGPRTGTDITAVAISQNGDTFVTADSGGIFVWAGPARWAEIICSKLSWNMSHRQWAEWVSKTIPYEEQCSGLPILPDESR